MLKKHLASITYAFTAILLFIFSFTCAPRSLDVSSGDVYFAIASKQIWLILASGFVFFAVISFVLTRTNKPVKPILFWIHILASVGAFVFLYFTFQSNILPLQPVNRSFYKSFVPYQPPVNRFPLGYLLIRFVIGSQLVFVAAVLLAVIKPKRREEF